MRDSTWTCHPSDPKGGLAAEGSIHLLGQPRGGPEVDSFQGKPHPLSVKARVGWVPGVGEVHGKIPSPVLLRSSLSPISPSGPPDTGQSPHSTSIAWSRQSSDLAKGADSTTCQKFPLASYPALTFLPPSSPQACLLPPGRPSVWIPPVYSFSQCPVRLPWNSSFTCPPYPPPLQSPPTPMQAAVRNSGALCVFS